MKRREFPKSVKAEIRKRCERPTGWACEECGLIVTSGEIDHTIAEALIVDKSKKLTAADGKFLCRECHQGPEGKTPKDKAIIAKAVRIEVKHARATAPKAKIPRPAKDPRVSKPPVARQFTIYREIPK